MLVSLALGNSKVLSFALGDAKVPNVNGFASQWNIGFNFVSFETGLKYVLHCIIVEIEQF